MRLRLPALSQRGPVSVDASLASCEAYKGQQEGDVAMKWWTLVMWGVAAAAAALSSSAQAVPVKFMCDMCESNWLHCMMKCHMEQYMTRHSYR